MIGHTQPRRIAARSVAERIAEELGTELGETVGYQVRFTDRTSTQSRGQGDDRRHPARRAAARPRRCRRYDTLIIDEAHERSLNIDFILGYLRQLLPRRPDLKVVITSATIDPERFAAHFADARDARADHRGLRARPTRSRCATGRCVEESYDDEEGEPRRPRPDRGDRGRGPRAGRAKGRATSWCSCPGSGRSATPPTCWQAQGRAARERASTSSRSTRGSPPPSSTGSSSGTPGAGWCWPPTSPRPR